ncbi:MAG: hypothetical protein JAY85_00010, partial [Candidatus Thiodiazotropha weberae]|nr:hypothetical protein [Candidatus Thiodiazotropha weberae]
MKTTMDISSSLNKTLLTFLACSLLVLGTACSSKEDRKQAYFDRGMELFDQGNYTKARLEFKNVL